MFSWNCCGCEKPILSKDVVNNTNKWMSFVVAVVKDGHFQGTYDGYGKIGHVDLDAEPCVWHKACWVLADMPKGYVESNKSDDETRFYEKENDFAKDKEPKKA
jgi:hypothetical protein